jgi:hypothetical protein
VRLITVDQALDPPPHAVGGAEEQKALQPDDENGVSGRLQRAVAPFGAVGAALVVAAGEHMADDLDPPVFDNEEHGGGDQADEEA